MNKHKLKENVNRQQNAEAIEKLVLSDVDMDTQILQDLSQIAINNNLKAGKFEAAEKIITFFEDIKEWKRKRKN